MFIAVQVILFKRLCPKSRFISPQSGRLHDIYPILLIFSAVRLTDFVPVPADPSDKSLGYFQSSAKQALSGTDSFGKAYSSRLRE